MLPTMLLTLDYELWKHEQACDRLVVSSPAPDSARTRCRHLDCRVLGWAGEKMVRWGLRLQNQYATPAAGRQHWATNHGR